MDSLRAFKQHHSASGGDAPIPEVSGVGEGVPVLLRGIQSLERAHWRCTDTSFNQLISNQLLDIDNICTLAFAGALHMQLPHALCS